MLVKYLGNIMAHKTSETSFVACERISIEISQYFYIHVADDEYYDSFVFMLLPSLLTRIPIHNISLKLEIYSVPHK